MVINSTFMNIIQHLKASHRLPLFAMFTLTSALSASLVLVRVQYTSKATFIFLLWNIFLAIVPYVISSILVHRFGKKLNIPLFILGFLAWLCFFPNAPYILTDLFHLKPRSGVPFWYDLALILSFAWNGLMLGYASLLDIQMLITRHFNAWLAWTVSLCSLTLGGFGIYLGRYLRWNTWDVVMSPQDLIADITDRVINPFAHPQTFGVTIIFSMFLIFGYLLLFQFIRIYQPKNIEA
jgi:uncharacterized membrane protein